MRARRSRGCASSMRSMLCACAATGLFAGSATAATVTAKAEEGGKIAPAGAVTARDGTTQQFGVTPNSGWAVKSVTGCNGTASRTAAGYSYTTGRLSGSCNVLASFVRVEPRLTSFKINNDAAETQTRSVTLAYTAASGSAASQYRVSMRADFLGAEWKLTSGTAGIPHELEPGPGTKTLYLQLRSATGLSQILSDSIILAQRQLYTVAAREFYDVALQAGFATRVDYRDTCTNCTLIPGPADGIAADHVVARASRPEQCGGSGVPLCRFNFFPGGTLRNGFVFKAIGDNAGVAGCEIFRNGGPAQGGMSVSFQVELYRFPTVQCQYRLLSMILEGPPNRSWREALGFKP